jgi:hypothetical protein
MAVHELSPMKELKTGLQYFFGIISCALAIRVIYISVADFFDPNSILFQMLDLPLSAIYMLDSVVTIIFGVLTIMLLIFMYRGNVRRITVLSALVWLFVFLELYLENKFRIQV